jgi:ADP-ribosylglycohydrolase
LNEYYLDWANKSYADTLAAIAGPIAYAYYNKMPDALVYQALKKLPDWMMDVCERFDEVVDKAE